MPLRDTWDFNKWILNSVTLLSVPIPVIHFPRFVHQEKGFRSERWLNQSIIVASGTLHSQRRNRNRIAIHLVKASMKVHAATRTGSNLVMLIMKMDLVMAIFSRFHSNGITTRKHAELS